MSKQDFNILIGVDMTNAESQIERSIKKIGDDFKLELGLVIDSKSRFFKQIKSIRNLFKNLGQIDLNFGLNDLKEVEQIKGKLKGMSNVDLSSAGKELEDSMEKAYKQIKKVEEAYDDLMKVQQKIDAKGNTFQTTKTGNKFANQSKLSITDKNGGIIENDKTREINASYDFDALNNYVNKAKDSLESMSNLAKARQKDVTDLVERLAQLNSKLNSGDEGFVDEVNAINKLIKEYGDLEKSMIHSNKVRETQVKEAIKWANKLKEVERNGSANKLSVSKYNRLVGELSSGDFKDLDKLQDKLREIEKQHALINEQMKQRSFYDKRNESMESLNKKVGKNINSDLIDTKQMNKDINNIGKAKDYTELDKAMKQANSTYDELVQKQQESSDVSKAENDAIKNKISRAKEEAKESNRLMEVQADRVQKALDDEDKYRKAHDEAKVKEAQQRGEKEWKSLQENMKQSKKSRDDYYNEQEKLIMQEYNDEESMYEKLKQNRIKQLDEETKESNRIHEIKAQQVQNALDEQAKYEQAHEKAKAKEAEARAKRESDELEKLNQERLKKIKERDEAEQRLESQMADAREKSEIRRRDEDRSDAERQSDFANKHSQRVGENQVKLNQNRNAWDDQITGMRNNHPHIVDEEEIQNVKNMMNSLNSDSDDFDSELKRINKTISDMADKYQTIHDRQRKINTSTHDWKKEIDNIKQGGFVNDSEFANVRKMMANLRHDSQSYEKDLKNVQNALQRMNTLSDKRKERQETRDVTKGRNTAKLEGMRGTVPDSLVDNVKGLNSMIDFSSSRKDLALIEDEMKKIAKLEQDIISAGRDEAKIRELIANHQMNAIKSTDKLYDTINEIVHQSGRQIQDAERRNNIEQQAIEIQQRINALRERGTEITYEEQRAIQQEIQALRQLSQQQRDVESERNNRDRSEQRLRERFESNSYRATRGFSENSSQAQQIRQELSQIEDMFSRLANEVGDDFARTTHQIEEAMNRVNRNSRTLREEDQRRRSSMAGTLVQAIKKVPVWSAAVGMVYGTIAQIQQGFQQILDIDKAMINLAKVSEASTIQLDQFKSTASAMGRELGVVASDVIKATTDFQKLGYTLAQSTVLGKNSLLYANVGDMSVEDAGSNITSTIKGFGVEVDAQGNNIRSVVDMFNEVSNNFSISAEGIGEGLKRSSAVMKEAGNTIEDSIGLMTAANAVIQDPKKVGNGLKTIAMRLRGVSDEGEDVQQLVPQLTKTFERLNQEYGLTGENQLKLMKEDGKTFKSTYDIFESVTKIWKQLSDIEQANLVETMGGKHQGVVVASIINNWKDAKASAETAMNSAGSASREFEAYTGGFEYRIGKLKNALEKFWTTLIDDDAVKGLITGLTSIIDKLTELVDTFGGTRILAFLTAMGAFLFSKGLRDSIYSVSALSGAFKGLGGWILKAGAGLVRMIPYLGVIMLVSEGIGLIGKAITAESRARKEKLKLLDDEIAKLTEADQKYRQLFDVDNKGDNKNLKRFGELQAKGNNRTSAEQDEFLKMSEDIKREMPQLISYYDDYQKAVIKTADEIKRLRDEQEKVLLNKEVEQFKTKLSDTKFKDTNKTLKDIGAKKTELSNINGEESFQQQMQDYVNSQMQDIDKTNFNDIVKEYNKKLADVYNQLPKEQQKYAQEALNKLSNLPLMMNKEDMSQQITTYLGFIQEKRKYLQGEQEKLINSLSTGSEEFDKMFDTAFNLEGRKKKTGSNDNKYSGNELLFLDDLRKSMRENIETFGTDAETIINEVPTYIQKALGKVEGKMKIDDLIKMNPETSMETVKQIDSIMSALNPNDAGDSVLIKMLDKLRTQHNQTYLDIKNKPLEPFSMQMNVLPQVKTMIDDMSDLDSAYRELKDGQELSLGTVMDLISKHPDLIKSMKMENGVLKLTSESIKQVAKIREEEFKSDIRQKKEQRVEALKNAKVEIESNKSIMESYLSKMKVQNLTQIPTADKVNNLKKELDIDPKTNKPQFGSALLSPERLQKQMELKDLEEQLRGENATKNEKALEAKAKSIQEEIDNMDKILSQDFTSQLGNLTGGGDKGKDTQDGYYVIDQYAKSMDWLNKSIEKQQQLQAENSVWSDAHRKAINDEIWLTNEKKKAIDGEVSSLMKQIEAKKIEKKGLVTVDSNKENNKTARLKAAEIQQEIDQASDKVSQLQSESIQAEQKAQELGFTMVKSRLELYNIQREMLSDDLAYQEYAMGLYDETAQSYRDHANEKLKILQEEMGFHKEELALLEEEKSANTDLNDSQIGELNSLIRAKRQGILEMANTIQEVKNLIASSSLEEQLYRITSESDKYAKMIGDIEDKMKYEIGDGEGWKANFSKQIGFLKDIVALRKGEASDAERNVKYLKEQLEANKDNKDMVQKITDEIKTWEEKLKGTTNAIKDTNLQIKDIYKQLSEDYVDLYKEQLQNMQQADEKFYKDSIDSQNKAHEQRMKQIEKESNALQDAYDKQMQLIDRTESTRTNDNAQTKLEGEANDLRKQIDLLSMDDSYESKSKKAELVKQLADKELELSELKHNREVELRKNDLEDNLKTEQEKLDAKKEKMDEEHQKLVDSLEKSAEIQQKYWADELNNEKKFAQLRKQVLDGNFDEMLTTISTWKDNVEGHMGSLGEIVTTNFTDKVKQAIDAIKELNNTKVTGFDSFTQNITPNNVDGNSKPQANLPKDNQLKSVDSLVTDADREIIRKMKINSDAWNKPENANERDRKILSDANIELSSKLTKDIGAHNENGEWLDRDGKQLYRFNTGGYTGDWSGDSGKIALLDKKELVLNEDQTKHILDTARIVEKIKGIIPSFNLLNNVPVKTAEPVVASGTTEHNEYNIDVTVNGNADKKVADTVANQIVNQIKRTKGGRF